MRWRKLGLVYTPDGKRPWALSHAMLPTPLLLADDLVRLYVSHTDEHTVGRVGYIDIRLSDPTRVLGVADRPLLDIGDPGTFDDNGVTACSVVPVTNALRLYYAGVQLQRKIPYTLFSGVAISSGPDGPFRRQSRVPVLDRVEAELFSRTAPFVMHENGRWRMWYVGGSGWVEGKDKLLPSYSMRHIESEDGLVWNEPSTECFAPQGAEIGFGRPFIVHEGAAYRMWYAVRYRTGYDIGYATSSDGLRWTRRDNEAGIARSQTGWDSEMICFPAVIPRPKQWIMFYNGNGYGRTGVGVAVADPE
jgi:predicted GH43/DUF377 family glycosyl hydrolase